MYIVHTLTILYLYISPPKPTTQHPVQNAVDFSVEGRIKNLHWINCHMTKHPVSTRAHWPIHMPLHPSQASNNMGRL